MKTVLASILALASLGGCALAAQKPTMEQFAAADYGAEISQHDCERIAREIISGRLKDPYSAQFTFGTCQKGYEQSVPIMGLPVAFGYYIEGTVNAKNSFGGYVGAKKFTLLMKNGRGVRIRMESGESGLMMPEAL